MITRKNITNRIRLLGKLLEHHYFINGYEYTDEDSPFRISSKTFYNILEIQECVDLKYRLERLQKALRASQPLTTKTKLVSLNYVDVIMEDDNLKLAAMDILTKLITRYQNNQFRIDINLDEDNEDINLLEDFL